MTAALALADGWEETDYEAGTYGPDGTAGLAATFERASMAVRVVPVRYDCTDGTEELRVIDGEVRFRRRGAVAPTADADRQTAFATVTGREVGAREEESVVCVAADAGDALAAAVWLTEAAGTERDLRRTLRIRDGGGSAVVTDDDVLDAQFADSPRRCIVTGRPTRSHRIEVPYRYYPALEGAKYSRGIPRIPYTVRTLVGAVSHTAWEDHGLDGVAFDAPVERTGPGEYRLEPTVAELMGAAAADDVAIERLV